MKSINSFFVHFVLFALVTSSMVAQSPAPRNPDVSNKALITKSTPSIDANVFKNQSAAAAAAALRKMADDYYA